MSEQPPSRPSHIRDSFAALREFLIVVAMLSIVFVPDRVKSLLDDAGIRSLAGVEFDTDTLVESEVEVAKAQGHIDQLQRQLAAAQQELAQATYASGEFYDPGLDTVSQILANAQRATIETETNLNRSHAKTRDLLQRHGRKPAEPATDEPAATEEISQAAADPPEGASDFR